MGILNNDIKVRAGLYMRVSTDDQRDNGYSIDSQLRMIKEYCEKNEYDIVVYNDAGHSGKDTIEQKLKKSKFKYLLKLMIYNLKLKNSISMISIVKK